MRIIGGKLKGRQFHPPADKWPTRPTTDYAKEGLFNIINNNFWFDEIKVLDLFGGTGSHSYEFISFPQCGHCQLAILFFFSFSSNLLFSS